jgi:hypothetical protein
LASVLKYHDLKNDDFKKQSFDRAWLQPRPDGNSIDRGFRR